MYNYVKIGKNMCVLPDQLRNRVEIIDATQEGDRNETV